MSIKRILVVDDEKDILELLIFRLKKNNFDVKLASTGKAAMDILKKDPVDLVLLDLRLPDMDGYEVCRQIKNDEKLKKIKIIFITASGSNEGFLEKFNKTKADGYVFKPFDFEQLLSEINKSINQ